MAAKQRQTSDPRIWWQYWCWCVQFWMNTHKPYYPLWFRVWCLRHYGQERYSLTWQQISWWQQVRPGWQPTHFPLPWYIGAHAFGPFVTPWNRIAGWFRAHTGGRSHRCEFTDPKRGALYGHQNGAFMDEYFEQLIENISAAEVSEEA